jgi:hypothetical protein
LPPDVVISTSLADGITRAGVLNDYLDAYLLKTERDEAIEIIRNCQRALAGYQREDGGEKELVGRLIEILQKPGVAAMTARNDKFISHVS